jgi:hypothetical protein
MEELTKTENMNVKPIVVIGPAVVHQALLDRLEREGYLPIIGRPHHIEVKVAAPALDPDAGFWERLFFCLWEWQRERREM